MTARITYKVTPIPELPRSAYFITSEVYIGEMTEEDVRSTLESGPEIRLVDFEILKEKPCSRDSRKSATAST